MSGSTDPRMVVGASIWTKGTIVTSDIELHRRYGKLAHQIFIPGIVIKGYLKPSAKGRNMKYVDAVFYLGGSGTTQKTVAVSSTKSECPTIAPYPDGLDLFVADGGTISIENLSSPSVASSVTEDPDEVRMDTRVRLVMDESEPSRPPRVSLEDTKPTPDPSIYAHGIGWTQNKDACDVELNGRRVDYDWSMRDYHQNVFRRYSDTAQRLSRLDYFFMMFPPSAIRHIITLTNVRLGKDGQDDIDVGELVRFFGLILLMTRYDFSSRRDLWSTEAKSKYMASPAFGRLGMSRNRFEMIWKALRFSYQPDTRPDEMPTEEYRWMLVDDFIQFFNSYREKKFFPGAVICVDESISRWYGLGGDWINEGLPMYVAIDRKPESGCEIQAACCGQSGVMIQLKIVKSSKCRARQEEPSAVNHGTAVCKDLVKPFAGTHRIVVADSFFASVQCAQELFNCGMRFIGVVKTATKGFPVDHLNLIQLNNRGDHYGVFHKGETVSDPDLMAFTWVDRERRNFISSASNLRPTEPIIRFRTRQVAPVETQEAPERVRLSIPQVNATKIYYDNCGRVDQHNRYRQETLNLEKKLQTNDWAKRVCMSVFGMIVVDSYLARKECTGDEESFNDFIHKVADEMIDYDLTTRHQRETAGFQGYDTPMKRCASESSAVIHLTPNKKMRPNPTTPTGRFNKGEARQQRWCEECRKYKTTWVCSHCSGMRPFCHTRTGRTCFEDHCGDIHAGRVVQFSSSASKDS